MAYKCPDCGSKRVKCIVKGGGATFEIHCAGKCGCAADSCQHPLERPDAPRVTYDDLLSELYTAPEIGVCEHMLGFLISRRSGVLAALNKLRDKGAVRIIDGDTAAASPGPRDTKFFVPGSLAAGKEMARRVEPELPPIDLTKDIGAV
jgi:hypothetical protein